MPSGLDAGHQSCRTLQLMLLLIHIDMNRCRRTANGTCPLLLGWIAFNLA